MNALLLAGLLLGPPDPNLPAAEGFRGVWYANQPQPDEYAFKYAGGMATYPQQHSPQAVYDAAVGKTFFAYGGVGPGGSLLHCLASYDHADGTVSRPRVLLDKGTGDAHDNPTLALDGAGYLWAFSNAHGTARPSYISRSVRPHDATAFETVRETNFSYGQPWWLDGRGFLLLHTKYGPLGPGRWGRGLYFARSPDGLDWTEPAPLARAGEGHYQVSWRSGGRVGTALNVHPAEPLGAVRGTGLNARTNLYYLQTDDGGETWTAADGAAAPVPIETAEHPSLVRDFAAAGRLVYLKTVSFTAAGDPILLFVTAADYPAGPVGDPRRLEFAAWEPGPPGGEENGGGAWRFGEICAVDHNYDFAALTVEDDGAWRVLGTTGPGPQPYGTGGEVVLWTSPDAGRTWASRAVTAGSTLNHNYPRRVLGGRPDFFALWADGHARRPSESRLYLADRDGRAVRRLPFAMTAPRVLPEPLPAAEP